MKLCSLSQHFYRGRNGFCRVSFFFLTDHGAHSQTRQKPLTVMNVLDKARKHFNNRVRQRDVDWWNSGTKWPKKSKEKRKKHTRASSFKCFNCRIIALHTYFRRARLVQTQTEAPPRAVVPTFNGSRWISNESRNLVMNFIMIQQPPQNRTRGKFISQRQMSWDPLGFSVL